MLLESSSFHAYVPAWMQARISRAKPTIFSLIASGLPPCHRLQQIMTANHFRDELWYYRKEQEPAKDKDSLWSWDGPDFFQDTVGSNEWDLNKDFKENNVSPQRQRRSLSQLWAWRKPQGRNSLCKAKWTTDFRGVGITLPVIVTSSLQELLPMER